MRGGMPARFVKLIADETEKSGRALLQVRADGGHLTVEAIGGRQVYEFQRSKLLPVMPLSETEFYVDGRYHTRIAFTRYAAGNVSGAVLNPGRWNQKGRRIN